MTRRSQRPSKKALFGAAALWLLLGSLAAAGLQRQVAAESRVSPCDSTLSCGAPCSAVTLCGSGQYCNLEQRLYRGLHSERW